MYCMNCGSEIRDGVAFCDACGIPIKAGGRYLDNIVSEVPVENPPGIPGEQAKPWVAFLSIAVVALLAICIIAMSVFGVDLNPLHKISSGSGYSDDYDNGGGDASSSAASEYIMPEADSRVYDESEISGLDEDATQLAINELYARHGYIFSEYPEYGEYFSNYTTWYNPTTDTVVPEQDFNDAEYENFKLLCAHRDELNGSGNE